MAHNIHVPFVQPLVLLSGLFLLLPYLAAAFFSLRLTGSARRLPPWLRVAAPALLSIPYALVSISAGAVSPWWLALYALLPPAIAYLAGYSPNGQEVLWPKLLILAVLGLAVDLRWFEKAWPPHLSVFNKMLLLDAGIYAFVLLRPLPGAGFDLRLRLRDIATGLREFLFYLPIALLLGLQLGFLHLHRLPMQIGPLLLRFAGAWFFTFFFIAVPEELFFRGWLQNLIERRLGRGPALAIASVLFGLSHFNKRTAFFNWQYVLLATIAGIFYGRAWRRDRRVGASAFTHAAVDSVWSIFLR